MHRVTNLMIKSKFILHIFFALFMALFLQNIAAQNGSNVVFVWDVGGVILDWTPKEFITNYEHGKFLPYFQEIFGENWKKFDRGDLTIKEFESKFDIPGNEIEKLIYANFSSLKPNWSIIHLIQRLKKHGYKNYCLTNGSKEYLEYVNSSKYYQMHKFNLSELFSQDEIVLSASLHLAKPEKAIYDYTGKKFNLKDKTIIFIDDNKANIDGAAIVDWKYPILFVGIDDLVKRLKTIIEFDLDKTDS